MRTNFFKYHGLGNDFIIFDYISEEDDFNRDLVVPLCRREWGIGGDGVILASKPLGAGHARMVIYNADGSEAEMCGNGIRCLAAFLYTHEIVKVNPMIIETLNGAKKICLDVEGRDVRMVSVDMGMPEFHRSSIPMMGEAKEAVQEKLEVGGVEFEITCLSMGNPHCVIFVPDLETAPVKEAGPLLENHHLFPQRTNVEFVEVETESSLKVRVWERGVGETQACGTGACAAFAASLRTGRGLSPMEVSLPGGKLNLRVDEFGHIHMRGPIMEVFEGKLSDSWLRQYGG